MSGTWEALPEGYYAVMIGDRMTYWRRSNGKGGSKSFGCWPHARRGQHPTAREIYDATALILADPIAAARQFAQMHTRCCLCARRLVDAKSKVSAVGPECRKYVPAAVIDKYLIPAVAKAHAAAVTAEQEELFQ